MAVALYPLRFNPIFKERPWGGRKLERIYGTKLGNGPVGESWAIADREGAVSVIGNGSLAGTSLRWLLENRKDDVLGNAGAPHGRFPLLVKIIDARQPLSLQVHPPRGLAGNPAGEAKTEVWYVAHARRGAKVFAGFKLGATRAEFEARLRNGTVLDCIHRIPVATGDAMLVPGGRIHALGGHIVVFEIQQNSDTTYRVFDWNRTDSNGRPRELQIENALRCIDFSDFEPALIRGLAAPTSRRTLVDEEAFRIELATLAETPELTTDGAYMILGGITSTFTVHLGAGRTPQDRLVCRPGVFGLVPACIRTVRLEGAPAATLLLIRPGQPRT